MIIKNLALIFIASAAIVIAFVAEPISQDPAYHQFADQRTVFGVANGYNVLSNLLFVLSGAWGLAFLLRIWKEGVRGMLVLQYSVFFAGILLIGMGSSWYHLHPSNASLFWDRLPMTVAFMALLSSVISECVHGKTGAYLLFPLLIAGAISVAYWAWTEQGGQGDLRPYAVVQFLPLVLIPLILLMYKTPGSYRAYLWLLVSVYGISKTLEHFDKAIYPLGNIVSGHTLKHVLAALGTMCVLKMLYARRNELVFRNTNKSINPNVEGQHAEHR